MSKDPTTRKFMRTQDCSSVSDAINYRNSIFSEFSMILRKLHDSDTLVSELRDLNEKANQLLKARRAWEYRIKELGGPDYITNGSSIGSDSVSVKGFRYFGRSRELPDVVQIIEEMGRDRISDKKEANIIQEFEKGKESIDLVQFDESYYGEIKSDFKLRSSNLLPFDESLNSPGLDPLFVERVIVERKKKLLIAKLHAKQQQQNVVTK